MNEIWDFRQIKYKLGLEKDKYEKSWECLSGSNL